MESVKKILIEILLIFLIKKKLKANKKRLIFDINFFSYNKNFEEAL